MVSIGFEVIETSEAAELIVPGQRYATVTKARLIEVSLVDIGANNDAIRLHKDGQLITLSEGGNQPQMDIKTLALTLGLPETADEAAVNAKLAELKTANDDVENIRRENEQLKLSQVTAAVDAAIAAKKIPAEKKQHFLDLGKSVGIETLNATLDAITPAPKLSGTLQTEPAGDDLPKKGPWELRMDEIRAKLNK